jgi:GNAT superfamily N-acetyltransferase
MSVTLRQYTAPDDYRRVSDFLLEHYRPGNKDGNWVEPAWEYMHSHPMLDASHLEKIGIWEDGGEIVAVAHYEGAVGEAFFQFHPEYRYLRQEMISYAEENLSARSETDGKKYLRAYANNWDEPFLSLLKGRGYGKDDKEDRPVARVEIPADFPPIELPDGFRLTSLAEEPDWGKVHRVMWRGFNHPGEPPGGEDALESRKSLFDTPSARRDLKIVVKAPNGDFVSLCGMFYVASLGYAYVEPVATDPEYRRMGLGKAAVLEGIRRCGALGAREAYVVSDQLFYLALGFEVIYTSECWARSF